MLGAARSWDQVLVQVEPSSRADLLGNRIFETCLQFPDRTRFRD